MNAVFPPWPIREFRDRSDGIPESGREDSIFRGKFVSFTAYLSPHALRSTGKNEWRPFEQAAHLYRMWEKGGYSEARLAEFFRQSKTSISAKIRAYRLMAEKYVPEYKDANVMGKWSYFEEFYKNCKPKANDPDGIELENKFVDWVGTGKFSRGEEVRELPKILKNPEAREAFEAKGFPDAWEDVKTDSPELDSTLWRAVARAIKELHDAPKSEINDVRDGNDAKRRRLLELKAEIDEFLKHAK